MILGDLMALSDEHWNLIMQAVQLTGGNGPVEALEAFKANWELYSNQQELQTFVDDTRLQQLTASKAVQEQQLAATNAAIEELEG
jgi:hypothetical protein